MVRRACHHSAQTAALMLLVSAALLFTSPLWADERPVEVTSTCTATRASTTSATITSTTTTPTTTPETPGHRSVRGRPLEVIVAGEGEQTVLILAGIHGDEAQGVDIARALAEEVTGNPGGLRSRVVIMPAVNPDGLAAGTRGNARGVDLNRNYPTDNFLPGQPGDRFYGGPAPASEPETQAVLALIEHYRPDLVVALHAPLACVNYDGPAENAAAALAQMTGLPLEPDLGYATPGSLGTFYGREAGRPVITVELGDEVDDLPILREALLSIL